MNQDEDRQDRYQRATASAAGAILGAVIGGSAGAIVGAAAGPLCEPYAAKIWEEVTADGRRRAAEVLGSACDVAGLSPDEITGLIDESEQTRLLAGAAMAGATRTAWPPKVRALGRLLADGLLAEDAAKVDIREHALPAMLDMERRHVAMLELLVEFVPSMDLSSKDPLPYKPFK